jgi:2,4-dienoyl-CoA reductase-like NADH-dependent reductase (Old Yellow Enzyme family)
LRAHCGQEAIVLFDPFQINNVTFANRVLRSSMGGRTAYYDGTVSPAWVHFEKRFAHGGVAGIISPTISVNEARMSPLEYPSLHDDRFIIPLRDAVREIRSGGPRGADGCRYIVQIGDTGGHTHSSLKPQDADRVSSSAFFDTLFGYQMSGRAMSAIEVEKAIKDFTDAAVRVQAAECDGIEVTASKGYLIHQFLNPAVNRRTDQYGGTVDNRFRLLGDIVTAIRKKVGRGFLFGVRLSASDYYRRPFNIRFPLERPWPSWREFRHGNDLPETTYYARKLEKLGVDYLHIDSGFGFPNPAGSPGDYPDEGFRTFVNAVRFLSRKAGARATLFNLTPTAIRKRLFAYNWYFKPAANAELAAAIRRVVNIPVIANGGFQDGDVIEGALAAKKCDMVAIARPLLANPDLLEQLRHANRPERPCSYCTLCCSHTAVYPLGCYDQRRFKTQEAMMNQVLAWCSPHAPFSIKDGEKPTNVPTAEFA